MIFITFSTVLMIISQYLNNFLKNIHNSDFKWIIMEDKMILLNEVKTCRCVLNMVNYFLKTDRKTKTVNWW